MENILGKDFECLDGKGENERLTLVVRVGAGSLVDLLVHVMDVLKIFQVLNALLQSIVVIAQVSQLFHQFAKVVQMVEAHMCIDTVALGGAGVGEGE